MKIFQRLESVAILVLLLFLYYRFDLGWGTFALFILVPDISMIGYLPAGKAGLKNPKIGATIYNIGHSYFSPIAFFGLSVLFDYEFTSTLSLIWAIHIAGDRALGFGLKLPSGFKDTNLGKI